MVTSYIIRTIEEIKSNTNTVDFMMTHAVLISSEKNTNTYSTIGQINQAILQKVQGVSLKAMYNIIDEKMKSPNVNVSPFFDLLFNVESDDTIKKGAKDITIANNMKKALITFIYGVQAHAFVEKPAQTYALPTKRVSFTSLFNWVKQYIKESDDSNRGYIVLLFSTAWNYYNGQTPTYKIEKIQAIFDDPTNFINTNMIATAPPNSSKME